MATQVKQAAREFIIRETPAELRIVEVFPGTADQDEHVSRQAAWDRARAQEKPVVILTLDRAPQHLGVVYSPAAVVKHAQPAAVEEGYFVLNGEFVKVMLNRRRTRHYARTLDAGTGAWEWAPGLMAQWKRMRPITPEDAKLFGDLHHYCFKCGTELTDPKSIEDGIGPHCKKKLGWL